MGRRMSLSFRSEVAAQAGWFDDTVKVLVQVVLPLLIEELTEGHNAYCFGATTFAAPVGYRTPLVSVFAAARSQSFQVEPPPFELREGHGFCIPRKTTYSPTCGRGG